jgi:RNase P/RNase MRP subunit p30
MKVTAPKNETFKKLMSRVAYKPLKEDDSLTVLDGMFSVEVSSEDLKMHAREFKRFCDAVIVEGGKKVRKGTLLIIEPLRTRQLKIRLSDEEYEKLKRCAKMRMCSISFLFRGTLLSAIAKRRELW